MLGFSLAKESFKRNKRLIAVYETSRILFRKCLYKFSPILLVQYLFITSYGRIANLNKPSTFDEKLLWLMLYWDHPLKIKCADKWSVRSYVEDHDLGDILPKLLGVYDNPADIDYVSLPKRFVLKCTHGSRLNIICKNKEDLNIEEANRTLDAWLKIDYSTLGGETHYAFIRPRIICEEYLENLADASTDDYKVFCFGGKAHCTMVCSKRDSESAKFDFYDREWRNKLAYSRSSLLAKRDIAKPEAYSQIIEAAEILSEPFPFVRVDFYNINGKAVFGEMTFTPNGCIDRGYTELAQNELGKLLRIPL